MRRLAFFVVLGISVSAGVCAAQTIKIGWFDLEPFMIDPGSGKPPTGVTIDYMEKYVAPKMGVTIQWVGPFPFLRLSDMLKTGQLDAVVQLTRTADRAAVFTYPATQLSTIVTCVALRSDDPLNTITKGSDLFNKTIGFLETGLVPPILKDPSIKWDLTGATDYRQVSLDKLLAKRFDAYLDLNYASFLYYIATNGYKGKVKVLTLPMDPVPVYCLFAGSDSGKQLAASFDKVNADLIKRNVFDTLTKQYLK